MIVIVDYGLGNPRSVNNMLKKLGAKSCISSDEETISIATKIILPGVGHYDHGMKMLKEKNLIDVLNWCALEEKKGLLGICLGSQILGIASEEGEEKGLSWVDMECIKFPISNTYRVPNMGWSNINKKKDSPLLDSVNSEDRFYFVHSYYMQCADNDNVIATNKHGIDYTCAVNKDNIYGVQFHPEKSLKYGMKVLSNFIEMR